MARIFLCHASEDKPQVREVYQRLKGLGFEPWLDEEEILPGQDWDYEIETALETSDFVMVFLSTRSVGKTGYVQREFRRALYHSEEIPEGQIHTIPVKLDDCDVPRRFSRHQWARLDDKGAFERIIRALYLGLEQRGLPMPEPSVPASAESEPTASDELSPTLVVTPTAEPRVVTPEAFTNSIGMTLVLIPAGSFLMGSPDSDLLADDDEKPQHQVTISQAFYLGIHPVTQAQWEEVMGNNPSSFPGNPRHPVENVSWDDAQQFLERLSELDGRRYTLPSEAQWEYACRAGSTSRYCFGDAAAQLGDYALYRDNLDGTTHPVGEKRANAWGFYDMHGQVWEWCEAWLGNYQATAVTDPSGPSAGASRVIRGGSWVNSARNARSAYCDRSPPGFRVDFLGFRCLRSEVS